MDTADDPVNPYAAPVSRPIPAGSKGGDRQILEIFVVWEKLRLPYNAILALVAIAMTVTHPGPIWALPNIGKLLCTCCLAANIGYCVGPVLDGYSRLLGIHDILLKTTPLLFILITIAASGLYLALLSWIINRLGGME